LQSAALKSTAMSEIKEIKSIIARGIPILKKHCNSFGILQY